MIKMSAEDYNYYVEEWNKACRRLRRSRTDLKKVKIVKGDYVFPEDKRGDK